MSHAIRVDFPVPLPQTDVALLAFLPKKATNRIWGLLKLSCFTGLILTSLSSVIISIAFN